MINLETKLSKLVPNVARRIGPRVGIELEYEGFSPRQFAATETKVTKWYLENDPSLRGGGIELISTILQPGAVKSALEEAVNIIKASRAKAHIRCGVHVHLNMSDVVIKHLWNLIVLYVLMEPSIFKQFADGRESSHFCVPLWCNALFAQTLYGDIKHLRVGMKAYKQPAQDEPILWRDHPIEAGMVQEANIRVPGRIHDPLRRIPKPQPQLGVFNCIKYSALNFKPLSTLGSIEFRQHPATTDMKKIQRWVDFLLGLRALAEEYDDPLDILDQYEEIGRAGMCEKVGLEHNNVDELDQEEAIDVATMAAGHKPTPWNELEWEIN